MIKVLFDDQIFTGQRIGGISRYFSQLFKKFEENNFIDYKLPLIYSENIYLKELQKNKSYSFLEGKNFKGSYRLLSFFHKFNRFYSEYCLSRAKFDIFHPTDYDPYFLDYLQNKPFVLTVHDMIHEIYAGRFFKIDDVSIKRKRLLVQKACKIITISESTKKDIINFYGLNEDKISVIYHANSLSINLCEKVKIPERFLLFVGARGRYKNFNFFIKAISSILQKDRRLHVICVGGSDFTKDENIFLNEMEVRDQVLHYIVSDAQLVFLYKKAIAFVFPSLYEGFGLPMVEAASCGCPILANDCNILREVGQESALYFDGRNLDSIAQAVLLVIENEKLRFDLRIKGFLRAKDFSWEETARKTCEVYKSI